jgi:amino acid transporter
MKNIKKDYDKFYLVGAIVVASSVCFIINSIRTIYLKRSPKYNMVLALAIAAVTFLEICIAIGGIISARKRNDLKIESLKLVSLANSLISLTLVQTAILSFTTKGNMSLYNGISGIVFGSCATLIGFYMIFYIKKNTKKKLPEGNY